MPNIPLVRTQMAMISRLHGSISIYTLVDACIGVVTDNCASDLVGAEVADATR